MFAVAAVSSGEDPFGHLWHIATRKEHVPPKELRKRAETMWGEQAK